MCRWPRRQVSFYLAIAGRDMRADFLEPAALPRLALSLCYRSLLCRRHRRRRCMWSRARRHCYCPPFCLERLARSSLLSTSCSTCPNANVRLGFRLECFAHEYIDSSPLPGRFGQLGFVHSFIADGEVVVPLWTCLAAHVM